jgi:hypothetical protein
MDVAGSVAPVRSAFSTLSTEAPGAVNDNSDPRQFDRNFADAAGLASSLLQTHVHNVVIHEKS